LQTVEPLRKYLRMKRGSKRAKRDTVNLLAEEIGIASWSDNV